MGTEAREILGMIIGAVFFAVLMAFAVRHGGSIVRDLKGKDGVWQIVEVAHIVWLISFPAVVFASIFGAHVEPHVIYGLDIIGAAIIGGKVYENTHPPKL
jgi:cation transporter-like permease